MKKSTHQETMLARRTRFDDVYVPIQADVYTPELNVQSPSPRHYARNWLASAFVVVLLASSSGLTYGNITGTGAWLNDSEASTLNTFAANLLDFIAGSAPEGLKVIPEGDAVSVPITITPEPSSVPTNYRVTVVQTGGNADLCNALVASVATPFVYNGPLLALDGVALGNASLTIDVSLPLAVPDLPVDAPCTFEVVFKGWNAAVPENTGYSDEERVTVTIVDPPAPVSGGGEAPAPAVVEPPAEEPPVVEEVPADEPPAEIVDEPEPVVDVPPVVDAPLVVEEPPAPEPEPEPVVEVPPEPVPEPPAPEPAAE